jgi:predicted secreted Zn-dependent protease
VPHAIPIATVRRDILVSDDADHACSLFHVHRRHLLRQWLRDPELAWETPTVLAERWSKLYDGVTAENEVFPLEPFIRSESNKSR